MLMMVGIARAADVLVEQEKYSGFHHQRNPISTRSLYEDSATALSHSNSATNTETESDRPEDNGVYHYDERLDSAEPDYRSSGLNSEHSATILSHPESGVLKDNNDGDSEGYLYGDRDESAEPTYRNSEQKFTPHNDGEDGDSISHHEDSATVSGESIPLTFSSESVIHNENVPEENGSYQYDERPDLTEPVYRNSGETFQDSATGLSNANTEQESGVLEDNDATSNNNAGNSESYVYGDRDESAESTYRNSGATFQDLATGLSNANTEQESGILEDNDATSNNNARDSESYVYGDRDESAESTYRNSGATFQDLATGLSNANTEQKSGVPEDNDTAISGSNQELGTFAPDFLIDAFQSAETEPTVFGETPPPLGETDTIGVGPMWEESTNLVLGKELVIGTSFVLHQDHKKSSNGTTDETLIDEAFHKFLEQVMTDAQVPVLAEDVAGGSSATQDTGVRRRRMNRWDNEEEMRDRWVPELKGKGEINLRVRAADGDGGLGTSRTQQWRRLAAELSVGSIEVYRFFVPTECLQVENQPSVSKSSAKLYTTTTTKDTDSSVPLETVPSSSSKCLRAFARFTVFATDSDLDSICSSFTSLIKNAYEKGHMQSAILELDSSQQQIVIDGGAVDFCIEGGEAMIPPIPVHSTLQPTFAPTIHNPSLDENYFEVVDREGHMHPLHFVVVVLALLMLGVLLYYVIRLYQKTLIPLDDDETPK